MIEARGGVASLQEGNWRLALVLQLYVHPGHYFRTRLIEYQHLAHGKTVLVLSLESHLRDHGFSSLHDRHGQGTHGRSP
jgi:hypothetical protein